MKEKPELANERAMFEWLASKGVKVYEIEDVALKRLIFSAMNTDDKPRRFEIHITDLIYCLQLSFFNKVMPQEFSEDDYNKLWHWFRGKGAELGIVNTIKGLLKEGATTQKLVHIGKSMGSVDLEVEELGNVPYEITTRLYYGSNKNPRLMPPSDKVMQDIAYAVSEKKNLGRVIVYIMNPPFEEEKVMVGSIEAVKKIRRNERTWNVELTPKASQFFTKLFEDRGELLDYALETGDWSSLPKCYYKFRCDYCYVSNPLDDGQFFTDKIKVCELLENNKELVQEKWKEWKKKRDEYDIRRFKWLIKTAKHYNPSPGKAE